MEEVSVQQNGNPIYQFLKENNLTTKDESTFQKEYSDSKKAQELYGFFKENNLTQKDFDSFYGSYFKKSTQDWSSKVTTPSPEFNLAEQSNPKLVADVEVKQVKQSKRLAEINKVYDQSQGKPITQAIQSHKVNDDAQSDRVQEIEEGRAD